MASEKEKTGKGEATRSKNEKEHEDRQSTNRSSRSEQGRESSRSEKRDQGQTGHEERGAEQKGNRSSSKVKMPKLEAGKSNRTTDHDVIRQWTEERGGSPAAVKATEGKEDPGLLRINFPGYSGKYSLEDISWDAFFEKFDEKNLEFLYQDQTKAGTTSRFFKLVNRTGGEHGRGGSKEGSGGKEHGSTHARSESGSHSEARSHSKEKEK